MYTIHNQTIDQHLLSLEQRGNREFNQRLHPNIPGVLGVRIPDLRKLAKDIIKSGTQEDYLRWKNCVSLNKRMEHQHNQKWISDGWKPEPCMDLC